MKSIKWAAILGLLLLSTNVFAADGDLIVNGKIGVGTTSPSTPLEVNGVIKSTTGGVQFPDSTTQTTALPASCTSGQVPKWNGTSWACADDSTSGTGTVSIYKITNVNCSNNDILTTNETCPSIICAQGQDYTYYVTCESHCSSSNTSPVSCSNTYVGKLVP